MIVKSWIRIDFLNKSERKKFNSIITSCTWGSIIIFPGGGGGVGWGWGWVSLKVEGGGSKIILNFLGGGTDFSCTGIILWKNINSHFPTNLLSLVDTLYSKFLNNILLKVEYSLTTKIGKACYKFWASQICTHTFMHKIKQRAI